MAETIIPMVDYWMGEPISAMSRDDLEREFANAHQEIAELQSEVCDRSVAHVRDLSAMRRR